MLSKEELIVELLDSLREQADGDDPYLGLNYETYKLANKIEDDLIYGRKEDESK